jgi:hypothetical protein
MSLCFVWKLPPHCDCQSFARVRQYRRRGFSELLQREFRERETREGRSVYDLFLGYGVHRWSRVSVFSVVVFRYFSQFGPFGNLHSRILYQGNKRPKIAPLWICTRVLLAGAVMP